MHKVDASSEPLTGLVELAVSNLRVCGDCAKKHETTTPFSRSCNETTACGQRFAERQTDSEAVIGTGVLTDASKDIPCWKRILDITLILLCLPLWLPVVIFISLWIKLASPGPILFRQERVGYRARRFMLFKFRTMKVNVETQSHERYLEQLIQGNVPMTKLDASGDPRIIPGGRILRATGLDELPQLFNVLRGEMSLVGPRPCTPNEFARYQAWQRERVIAAPGLTGYWQVSGKNKTTFTEMIKLDIFYTKKMSLWMDLSIMLRTFPAVLEQVIDAKIGTGARRQSMPGDSASKPVTEQC